MRIALLLLALPLACPAAAQEDGAPVVLQPASKWVLDYGETRCRIVRKFAAEPGGKDTLLYFEQYSPGDTFRWLVAGSALPRRSKIALKFGPDNDAIETSSEGMSFGEYERVVTGFGFIPFSTESGGVPERGDSDESPTRPEPPRHEPFAWIDIEPDTDRAVRLPVDNMPAIEQAMKTCMDDLVRSWGVDPAQQARVVEKPQWLNLGDIAGRIQRLYPSSAVKRGEQGAIQLRLMIEADGTPSKCVRTNVNQMDNMDNSACLEIIQNGEFEPALDAEGRPVRSFLMQRIRYVIP